MGTPELRLPVDQYAEPTPAGERIEPVFKIGDVEYFGRLPSAPTERKRQTLLPVDGPAGIRELMQDRIDAWNKEHPDRPKSIRWQADESGLEDPNFGSVKHYATVDYDDEGNVTDVVDDTFLLRDGKLDPRTGIATPGAVVAPIEKRPDGYYVHCFWQWRPAAWDQEVEVPSELTDPRDIENFIALHRGEWMLSIPGGYAKKVGALFAETAATEAMEEAGLKIDKRVSKNISFNRARSETKIGIGFSTFERVGDGTEDAGELLSGRMAVRIDQFRSTDAMAMACVNFAREQLGLVSAGTAEREADQATIAELRAQLAAVAPEATPQGLSADPILQILVTAGGIGIALAVALGLELNTAHGWINALSAFPSSLRAYAELAYASVAGLYTLHFANLTGLSKSFLAKTSAWFTGKNKKFTS